MSDQLQKNLNDKSNENTNLQLLVSQWGFDKELIPKALQQIANLFPHYSRHDQSHSKQILINIERILGEERVSLLSATDTWLLLESAYWHDIGMVVPHQEIADALKDPEFQIFLQAIVEDRGNELQAFAKKFKSADLAIAFTGADNPLDAVEKFRTLMAEWFRRKHPRSSENSINEPWEKLGLSSPRTELIPKRLFRTLGKICFLHGASFENLLNQLPHKEVGMSNDDCHPRFVASLLRLGDLLDMDDNRFCPVMQRIVGNNRPSLTKAHEDKHSSIRHFRLDSNRIEIHAVCETIDGYVEQWRWLDYLRNEIQNQMARWQDIAPSPALGLLPTLGDVKVDIAERQLITKAGARPEFSLHTEKVMELLRGENLYQREDAIRELLQNAVDATILRVWLESKIDGEKIGERPDENSNNYLEKYKIIAKLERLSEEKLAPDAKHIEWELSICDFGVGISQDDLKSLIAIAGSSTNIKKKILIDEMPEWLQPSGVFGIGLQSAFMLTDKIRLKTKSFYTSEALAITLHSPTGSQHGLVTVELLNDPYLIPIGTELKFNLTTEINPYKNKKFMRNLINDDDDQIASRFLKNHDWLLDKEMPLSAYKICDAFSKFQKNSPINLEWNFNNLDDKFCCLRDANQENLDNFISVTNSKFNLSFNMIRRSNLYYRGQRVKEANLPEYYFFGYELDLYAGKAADWLTFNRNNIKHDSLEKIDCIVTKNLKEWVIKHKDSLSDSDKTIIFSLAKLRVTIDDSDQSFWSDILREHPDEWLNFKCQVLLDKNKVKARKLIELDLENTVLDMANSLSSSIIYNPLTYPVVFISGNASTVIEGFLIEHWFKNNDSGIRYILCNVANGALREHKRMMLQLTKDSENKLEIADSVLVFAIEKAMESFTENKRLLLPLSIFPGHLALDKILLVDGIRSFGFETVLSYLPPQLRKNILLPFEIKKTSAKETVIELSRLDEFIKWVNANAIEKLTLNETEKIYLDLIDYVDNHLMKGSADWQRYRFPLQNEN